MRLRCKCWVRQWYTLVRHPLFHFLMTCGVILNADALFGYNAYFAFLSSWSLVTLCPEEPSNVTDVVLLENLRCCAELVYSKEQWFRDVQKNLVQCPEYTPSSVVGTVLHLLLLSRWSSMDVAAGRYDPDLTKGLNVDRHESVYPGSDSRARLTRGEMPQSMLCTLGATPEQPRQSSPVYLWSDSGAGHTSGEIPGRLRE